jgi:hypothetical protein
MATTTSIATVVMYATTVCFPQPKITKTHLTDKSLDVLLFQIRAVLPQSVIPQSPVLNGTHLQDFGEIVHRMYHLQPVNGQLGNFLLFGEASVQLEHFAVLLDGVFGCLE